MHGVLLQFPSPFVLPNVKSAASDDAFTPPERKAVSQVVEGVAIVRPVNALLGTALNNTARGPVPTGINPPSTPSADTSTIKAAERTDNGANSVSMQVAEDKPYPGGAAPLNNGIPPSAVNVGSTAAQGPPKSINQGPPQTMSTPPAQPQTVPTTPAQTKTMPAQPAQQPPQKLPIQGPPKPAQQPLPVFQPPVPAGGPVAKKVSTRPDVTTESAQGVYRVSTAPISNKAGNRRFLQALL